MNSIKSSTKQQATWTEQVKVPITGNSLVVEDVYTFVRPPSPSHLMEFIVFF